MHDKEEALAEALQAGINVLKKNFGDDYDRALVLSNVPMLLGVMWPTLEAYHDHSQIRTFEECFRERFPNHVMDHYGGSVLDYIMGNVQTAVANEILVMMENYLQTLEDAASNPTFAKNTIHRDWQVAEAHVNELMSEVRQYRARGNHGLKAVHTGSMATQIIQEQIDAINSSNADAGSDTEQD